MRKQLLLWGAAMLPLLLVAALWTRLPAQVPVHWDVNGDIRYGSRWMLWLIAAFIPALLLLTEALPKADPRRDNYRKFERSYAAFQTILVLFLDALMAITLTESLRPGTFQVGRAVQLLLAVLMMTVGNMMPKFRQTYFMGIKNAWTLSNELVWTRTHRLGGRMFFAAGMICLLCMFLPAQAGFLVMLAAVLAAALVPTAMSYLWFRRLSS